jgi:hypothetical protein
MANHGKPWLPENDTLLVDNVVKSNEELAELFGRSAHAVACRRAILAIALSKQNPSISIDECISLYRADTERVKYFLEKKKHGSNTSKCTKTSIPSVADGPVPKKIKLSGNTEDNVIQTVADCIQRDGGYMANAWRTPEFVAVMIKYHSGFEAYSAVVRAQGSVLP